jgi:hypothetical protein
MEVWRAEPGDVVRLPASCWPRVVLVTGCAAVYGTTEFVRLSWEDEDEGAYGSTVLPDTLEVDLLFTERADKRCFLARTSALIDN